MKSKTSFSAAPKSLGKLPVEAQKQLSHTVKASTLMDINQASEHVAQTAGLVFEKNNEPIAVSEFRLKEAQRALDEIDTEIIELERELKNLSPTISSGPTTKEDETNAK